MPIDEFLVRESLPSGGARKSDLRFLGALKDMCGKKTVLGLSEDILAGMLSNLDQDILSGLNAAAWESDKRGYAPYRTAPDRFLKRMTPELKARTCSNLAKYLLLK